MALQLRRVVTGHDANGRAVVEIDEVSKNLSSGRPGATACVVWTTESFPVDNTGEADEGLHKVGTTLKNGTVFRVVEFAPGIAPRIHRTDSIDCAIVMSGEIDMEIDDSVVHLKAGDGSFMMEQQELATARYHNIPVMVLILRNNAYGGMKRDQQKHYGGRIIGTELFIPDLAKLAALYGARGYSVTKKEELTPVFREALAKDEFVIVDVKLD